WGTPGANQASAHPPLLVHGAILSFPAANHQEFALLSVRDGIPPNRMASARLSVRSPPCWLAWLPASSVFPTSRCPQLRAAAPSPTKAVKLPTVRPSSA